MHSAAQRTAAQHGLAAPRPGALVERGSCLATPRCCATTRLHAVRCAAPRCAVNRRAWAAPARRRGRGEVPHCHQRADAVRHAPQELAGAQPGRRAVGGVWPGRLGRPACMRGAPVCCTSPWQGLPAATPPVLDHRPWCVPAPPAAAHQVHWLLHLLPQRSGLARPRHPGYLPVRCARSALFEWGRGPACKGRQGPTRVLLTSLRRVSCTCVERSAARLLTGGARHVHRRSRVSPYVRLT